MPKKARKKVSQKKDKVTYLRNTKNCGRTITFDGGKSAVRIKKFSTTDLRKLPKDFLQHPEVVELLNRGVFVTLER